MAVFHTTARDPDAGEQVAAIDRALRALGPVRYMVYAYTVTHRQALIFLTRAGHFRPKVGKIALGNCHTMHGPFDGRTEHVASLTSDADGWFHLEIGELELTAGHVWFGDGADAAETEQDL